MTAVHLKHDWFPRPLPKNIHLGERTWLHSAYAFAHYGSRAAIGLRVGSDTGLYPGTFFDLGPDGQVAIGNFCSLVGAIFMTNGRVTIGDYTFIAHEVVIADSDWATPNMNGAIDQRSPATPRTGNSIEIGPNVWIGTQAILLGNLRIGEGSIIGAGTLVTHDVPPYAVCAGNPMRVLKTIPRCEDSPG